MLTVLSPLSLHRRKPPNPEWKAYRRGIEWRCRWLELRTKELLCQEKRYAQLLGKFRTDKEAALVAQMLRHAGGPHIPPKADAHVYVCMYVCICEGTLVWLLQARGRRLLPCRTCSPLRPFQVARTGRQLARGRPLIGRRV